MRQWFGLVYCNSSSKIKEVNCKNALVDQPTNILKQLLWQLGGCQTESGTCIKGWVLYHYTA